MGKSSSSTKKKRSKISSQAQIKKSNKSRTRRNKKSKKFHHRDDSVSYSSNSDESRSSVSLSSSSSEDNYRRKRSRSRMRKDVKGSKKRARQQSSSHESIEDSTRVTRRKGSKKSDDIRVRKKTREKKKKSKRDVSVSSTNSGSWSCSTCQGRSSSSDESEVEKNRGRSERKDKEKRRLKKVKNGCKQGRSRSRSCSSCSRHSEYSDCRSEGNLTGEANSRRLKSVIIVTREGKEEEGMDNDEHKEEIVYGHGDYPSSRSNDSTDGGSGRELVHNSHISPRKRHAEDEKGEAVVSNIMTCKATECDKDNRGHAGSNPSCDGVGMNDDVKERKNKDFGATGGMNSYDLETILRQKALENLRMFRRGNQTDAKVPVNEKDLIGDDAKMLPTIKSPSSQNRSPVGVCGSVVGTSQVTKGISISADLSQNDENFFNRSDGKEIRSTKLDVAFPPEQLPLTGNPNERVCVTVTSESNQSRSVVLASKQESSSTCTTKKQLPALQEPPQAKSMSRNNVDLSMVETAQTVKPLSGNSNFDKANNVSTSDDASACTKSPSAGTSSNKLQDEANEGSEFQQKTMTVMRGGEMVEVSYKVYIPKKAPALARRPLKR